MDYAETYFESAHEEGFLTRNSVIDLATTDISEYIKTNSSQAMEGRKYGWDYNANALFWG
jgi:hypothetical protein